MGVNGHWYVEITKQGFWRGSPHLWQNRYVMSGATPSAGDAGTVIAALHDIENVIHPAQDSAHGVGFVKGSAYPSGSGPAFAVTEYNTSEGFGSATGFSGPTWSEDTMTWAPTLETCALVETRLTGLSSSGKPLALKKYIRGVNSGAAEDIVAGQMAAADIAGITAACAPWKTGMGSSSWVVIAPSGAQAALPPVCQNYLVAHQIPRGRRKKKVTSGGLTLSSLLSAGLSAAEAAAVIALAAG